LNELDPPPSVIELVKDNPQADAQWKAWLFNLFKWAQDNMSKDFFFEVDQDNINGYSSETKFGRNTAVTTTEAQIWPGGAFTYLTAASTVRIAAGGNAADTAAGTGAQEVHIIGLDADYNINTDTLVTAGASASSATTQTYLRVLRAWVGNVGSGEKNAGNITIEAVTGGTTQCFISQGQGQSQQLFFTVPAGKTAYIRGGRFSWIKTSGGGGAAAECKLYGQARLYNTDSNNNYESWRNLFDSFITLNGGNPTNLIEQSTDPIPEKTDIKVTGIVDAGSADIDGRLHIILVDN